MTAGKALSLSDRVQLEAGRAQPAPESRREEKEALDAPRERARSSRGRKHSTRARRIESRKLAARAERAQVTAGKALSLTNRVHQGLVTSREQPGHPLAQLEAIQTASLSNSDAERPRGGGDVSHLERAGGRGRRPDAQRGRWPSQSGAFSRARARTRADARRGRRSLQLGTCSHPGACSKGQQEPSGRAYARRADARKGRRCSQPGGCSKRLAGAFKPSARLHPGGMPEEAAVFKSGVCSRQAPNPSESSQSSGSSQPGEGSRMLSGS